ncbi:carbamoyltransferase HypF [bacterium]|nr:carbamoyltransferase HypF [bacterium]
MNRAPQPDAHGPPGERQRLHVAIQGTVQGVGFRPFVYRLATTLHLPGWVLNSLQGVTIEVEGDAAALAAFVHGLEHDKPALATIHSLQTTMLDPVGFTAFEIRHSDSEAGVAGALILPDLATCPDCLREVLDPHDRRYRYPFTNCTNCGPRFSIIQGLPYDRPQTTMRGFTMCEACTREYEDPLDRRFHAQPNACPTCGPHLELWSPPPVPLPAPFSVPLEGPAISRPAVVATHDAALRLAAQALREGRILALKGLGGFHLLVDARDEAAVRRLRERKRREEKPLALMMPSLEHARQACEIGAEEERLLLSPQCPILLLRRRPGADIAPAVAPGNPCLGVMLPYTPLHHLLLGDLGFAVVATSGNLSDEPICTDEHEALARLHGLADLFLVHNRPIARHMDDSVVRLIAGRPMMLRRARGYAPLPVPLPWERRHPAGTLALGAHLKNATALALGQSAFLSQHIGDLETAQALEAFRRVSRELPELYGVQPDRVVCDEHPDYLSTQHAHASGLPVVTVQHHVAHLLSCMAENELSEPVLGFSWDGSGYGGDGTLWGGEVLLADGGVRRVAHFRLFRLPGGDRAIKEPRRAALGVLYELYGDAACDMDVAPVRDFAPPELGVLRQMLSQSVNTPRTSSVGRLFDAVASLIGLRQQAAFEGQAAMELEYALDGIETEEAYPLDRGLSSPRGASGLESPRSLDWRPLIEALLADVHAGMPAPLISARFHNALAQVIVDLAQHFGQEKIALSGGCFQNKFLSERVITLARRAGLRPYWHQNVPPNDGGIALGQLVYAVRYAP